MKQTIKAYFHAVKWHQVGYVPPMEEYMQVVVISTGYAMLITSSFVGMGKVATKKAFDWISNGPKMAKASTIICRLMDDIVPHEFEQKRDHVASAVECYMNQYGLLEEEIVKLFREEIVNAWKDINEGFIKPIVILVPILTRVLNFAHVMDVIYKWGRS
ncbi:hypothetical protein SLE2022_017630 [Rubroshorea leprosula]